MTKRKTTTKQAPQAPTEAVESVEAKSNTTVASKSKQANSTARKASTGGRRGRPKKAVTEKSQTTSEAAHELVEVVAAKNEVIRVTESRTLYERIAAWLTYKLYQITSPFRSY